MLSMADGIVEAGKLSGSVAAVLALAGLIGRSKPGRYLWRQLVGSPVSIWLEAVITRVIQPLWDRLLTLAGALEDHMTQEADDRREILARLDDICNRFDVHVTEGEARDRRIDAHDAALGLDTRGRS